MKKLLYCLCFCLLSTSTSFALNLNQCVEYGLKNNPYLKSLKYTSKSREQNIKMALTAFLPQISVSFNNEEYHKLYEYNTKDYDNKYYQTLIFSIVQNIFAGFSDLASYQREKLNKAVFESQKKVEVLKFVRDVSTQFYGFLKTKEDIRFLKETILHLKVNVDFAKALFKKRFLSLSSLLNAEVDLQDAKQQLSKAQKNLEIYKENLKSLLGYPIEQDLKLDNISETIENFYLNYEECVKYALAKRPEIYILDLRKEIYKKEQKMFLGRMLPRIDLKFRYHEYSEDYKEPGRGWYGPYDRDIKSRYWVTGIFFTWDIGGQPRNIIAINQNKFNIQALVQQKKDLIHNIENDVKRYYLALHEAISRIKTTKLAKMAALESYKQAKERFRLLIGSIGQVLDAQARLTRAEANYNQAILDYHLNLINLQYVMAKFLEYKNIKTWLKDK